MTLIFAGLGILWQSKRNMEKVLSEEDAVSLMEKGIPEEVMRNAQTFGAYKLDYRIFPISSDAPIEIYFEKVLTNDKLGLCEDIKVSHVEFDENVKIEMDEKEQIPLFFTRDTMDSYLVSFLDTASYFIIAELWGHGRSWGLGMAAHENEYVSPSISLKLHKTNNLLIHKTIRLKLGATFEYPFFLGANLYDEKSKPLEREIALFIISESEEKILRQLFPKSQIPLGLRILFFFISAFFFFLAIRLLIVK